MNFIEKVLVKNLFSCLKENAELFFCFQKRFVQKYFIIQIMTFFFSKTIRLLARRLSNYSLVSSSIFQFVPSPSIPASKIFLTSSSLFRRLVGFNFNSVINF